jgi:hypothetical protein
VEYETISLRLENSGDLVEFHGIGLGMCASMFMFRDRLTVHDAFAAVVNSHGLRLECFG